MEAFFGCSRHQYPGKLDDIIIARK
jgi:hypothetical protein